MGLPYSILHGDVIEELARLPSGCVQCVVTSPPYWRLRDYGVEGQIGLEATPEEYVAKMVEVFREVRRVLRPDGTCFVNLGDTYSAGGVKPKELVGVPWRVAFALQADGWYLRQEIIWHKPAPMPESVRDRCCRAHEHVFLLTKSPRYYWDHVGAMESVSGTAHPRRAEAGKTKDCKEMPQESPQRARYNAHFNEAVNGLVSQRTPRSVWKIAAEPTKEKHFAAYPAALVAKCLSAGVSPMGCCPACGAPRRRLTEKRRYATRVGDNSKIRVPAGWASNGARHDAVAFSTLRSEIVGNRDAYRHVTETVTVGWAPGCECGEERSVGCVVLDPFSGTAQTGRVAVAMGHAYIGIELSEEFIRIAHRNIARGWTPKAKSRRGAERPRPARLPQKAFDFAAD